MPGPGAYEPPNSINQKGNYFNSKFTSSKCALFNPPNSKRFKMFSRNTVKFPGPGEYSPASSISKDGNYFLSKFKSSNCRTFYHYNRDTISTLGKRKDMPGPGMYRLPSEFGYYESNKKSTFRVKKKRRARSVEKPGNRNL